MLLSLFVLRGVVWSAVEDQALSGSADPGEARNEEAREGMEGCIPHTLTALQQATEDGNGCTQPCHISAPSDLILHHFQQITCARIP
jgi:hypothetical protein